MQLIPPRSRTHPLRTAGVRAAVALLALPALWLLGSVSARAETATIDGVDAPIVRVNIRSGDVTIRTWDRPTVQIDGAPATLSIERRATHQPTEQAPILIPQAHANGRLGVAQLAPESFVVSSIPPGPRDAVVVRSTPQTPPGPVVVTVPNDSVFVFAFAHDGNLDVRDYRGGTFVGFTTRGRLALQNVGGTVFAQTVRGALDVSDSMTDRMRARSLFGNVTFEHCSARQIEASSIDGSIVYDDGNFEPGLARFESVHGDVAIGTQSPAELGGRVAGDGRVFTNFDRGAQIAGRRDDASAVVGGGGPVVTATTQTGNVYLYDGTLHTRDRLPAWQQPLATIAHPLVRRDIAPGMTATEAPRIDPALAFPPPRPSERRTSSPHPVRAPRAPHRTAPPPRRR